MNTAFKFAISTHVLDFQSFCDILSDDCTIKYTFNDKPFVCDKSTYCALLKRGHFENTTNVDICSFSFKKYSHSPLIYNVSEVAHFTRMGLGRDEDGPGIYQMVSHGHIELSDSGKITALDYSFYKSKVVIERQLNNGTQLSLLQ